MALIPEEFVKSNFRKERAGSTAKTAEEKRRSRTTERTGQTKKKPSGGPSPSPPRRKRETDFSSLVKKESPSIQKGMAKKPPKKNGFKSNFLKNNLLIWAVGIGVILLIIFNS